MSEAFQDSATSPLAATGVQSNAPAPPTIQSPVEPHINVNIRKRFPHWSWLFVIALPIGLLYWIWILGFFMDDYVNRRPDQGNACYAQVNGPLTQACQAYFIRNQKWPANLNVLLVPDPAGTIYLDKRDSLIDAWGKQYRYDPKGPMNQGLKPDIWTVTPRGQVIGNWSKFNVNPR